MIDLSDAGGACIGGKFDPISRGLKYQKQYAGEKERSFRSFSFLLCGIAVLPCFSASGKVPVTRCGLPLRGTYAACGAYAPRKPLAGENDSTFSSGTAYWSSSRLDCHTLPTTTLRKVVAPIPSGQTGLDASRQAQFSASIVISM